ncbi:MAG: hypothetical protein ACLU8D_12350 [Enterocloster sp.]
MFTVVTTLAVYRLFLFSSRKLEEMKKETRPLLNDLYEIPWSLKKLLASWTFILGVFLYSCSSPGRSFLNPDH